MRWVASLTVAVMCWGASSYAAQQSSWPSLQLMSQDIITVVDENQQPVKNASILLGFEPGNPFPGNTLVTDANGLTNIPADWKTALPLTVTAPGFIATTLPVALPGSQVIQLTHQEGSGQIEIKGTTTGFGNLEEDGKVDFGLVIPAMDRSQMLAFDMSSVLSPEFDTISVIGRSINIPSNITLPDQTESYIFPIELNKPDYRSFVRTAGTYHLAALHGQFPLQRVVDEIQNGKSVFDVINDFSLMEEGERTLTVGSNTDGKDIAVNQTQFHSNFSVRAPALANGQIMLSLALSEQNNLMVPTDLKRLTSGQSMNLHGLRDVGTPYILSLLLEDSGNSVLDRLAFNMAPWFAPFWLENKMVLKGNPDFNRLSFNIQPVTNGVAPTFLPLINKPVLQNNVLKLDVPKLPNGLEPAATYLVYSENQQVGSGSVKTNRRTRLWEVWANGWMQQMELPKVSFQQKPGRTYSWEVLFLARPAGTGDSTVVGNQSVDLRTITHVTRNVLDL